MLVGNLEKLLVTYKELRQLGITLSREHITRLCRQGRFPAPIRLCGDDQSSKAFWKYTDIVVWIDERAEVSRNLPTKRPATKKENTAGSHPDHAVIA